MPSDRPARFVVAKTRKRCPVCRAMIEPGAEAILTDDRFVAHKLQWFGRGYRRGAWHLTHVTCADTTAPHNPPTA